MENNFDSILSDISNNISSNDVESCLSSVAAVRDQGEVASWRMFAHNGDEVANTL
jgi:hypothetical protein